MENLDIEFLCGLCLKCADMNLSAIGISQISISTDREFLYGCSFKNVPT